jgi:hypothetical protein
VLTPSILNSRLKSFARSLNLDPERISSHSLRAGAASALASANVPDYVIKNFGNWSSEAFLRYVRSSVNMYATVHDILANPASFSVLSDPSFA